MLAGKRIGVITNHSAMSSSGHTALDELRGLSAFTVGAVSRRSTDSTEVFPPENRCPQSRRAQVGCLCMDCTPGLSRIGNPRTTSA